MFWVLQNPDLIMQLLNKINKKKRTKSITTYDLSTLYAKFFLKNKRKNNISPILGFEIKEGNKKIA